MSEPDEPIEIRPYRPGDEGAIVDCWNAVMPAQDGRAPRDLDWWRWEFEQTPHGEKRITLGVHPDGRVIGQYAALPYRARADGGDVTISQIVDLVVLPEYRRKLERPGTFVRLGWRFHEDYCGRDKDILTYGYPIPAWKIGHKYLTYEMVRDTDMLFRECSVSGFVPRASSTDALEVVEIARAREIGDALWRKIEPEVGFGLVRDGAYLDWRFADHPQRSCYTMLLCRERAGGAPRGIAVFRVGDFVVEGAGLIVEWVCPREDVEAELCLIGRLEELTIERKAPLLSFLVPQSDPRFLRFQRHGFLVSGTPYFLVMTTFKFGVRWLREHWFYTLGDTDLV